MLLYGMPEVQLTVDRVNIPASVSFLRQVPRLNQVRNDPLGRTLGYPNAVADLTESALRVHRDAKQHMRMVGEERPVGHASKYTARDGDIHDNSNTPRNIRFKK